MLVRLQHSDRDRVLPQSAWVQCGCIAGRSRAQTGFGNMLPGSNGQFLLIRLDWSHWANLLSGLHHGLVFSLLSTMNK